MSGHDHRSTHSHDHGHSHEHGHSHALPEKLSRAFYWGIGLNSAYVIAELIAGWWQNSMALLSDAGHNLSDVAGLLIALLALRLSTVKANSRFTFGYKKSTVLASLINAVLLLAACGAILLESIQRIQRPEIVHGYTVSFIALIGIVVNAVSALFFFRDRDRDINVKGAYLHLMADAAVSAAVVLGGWIMQRTGWYWLDSVLSMAIVVFIVLSAWRLLWQSFRLSLDAVPHHIQSEQLQQECEALAEVENIHHLHIWAISTTYNALTAHVRLRQNLPIEAIAPIKEKLKHIALHHQIQHCTFEFEFGTEDCPDC